MENKKPTSYSEAIAQVEEIMSRLNDNTVNVDTLSEEVKRATELIKYCKDRLAKAEKEVNEILRESHES